MSKPETKQASFGVFGRRVNKMVPATAEVYDRLSGQIGACVDTANDKHGYHVYAGKVRAIALTEALKAAGLVDDDGKVQIPLDENKKPMTPQTAWDWLKANDHLDEETGNALIDDAGTKVPFPSASGRGIADKWLNAASEAFAMFENGQGTWDATVKNLETLVPGLVIGEESIESLARAFKAHHEYVSRPAGLVA